MFGDPTPRHYDAYTFSNNTGATQCVTVDPTTECVGTNYTFVGAYLGSFDPNNICTNWIGDSGSSPDPTQPPVTFQFEVPNGQSFVVVVSEVTPGAGCPAYTFTVAPETVCGGGTPTPTPSGTPTPTPCGSPSWVIRTPVPYEARGIFAVSDGGFVYAGGGYDGLDVHSDLLRYDIATNNWLPLASSPDQHFLSQAVFDNGKIYNMGGFDGGGGVSNITRIYTVATNTWTTGAPMPAALTDRPRRCGMGLFTWLPVTMEVGQ